MAPDDRRRLAAARRRSRRRAGADAFRPVAVHPPGPAHVLAVAGDALVAIALAGSLFFDLDPNDARWKVVLYLAADDGARSPWWPR